MSSDRWMTYNGLEFINLSRTAQLADTVGIPSLVTTPGEVAWVQTALGGTNYASQSAAPWYDAAYPASADFIGVVPLSVQGLDDSTYQSTPVEYVGDGGNAGKGRSATLSIVFNVALVGATEKSVRYGLSWLNQRLRNSGASTLCRGADLRYFNHSDATSTIKHRRDVKLTRAASVTRKRRGDNSHEWLITFTMTAGDPYEYSEPSPTLTDLGGAVSGPRLLTSGQFDLNYADCPVYDHSPVFDPTYPALVPAPGAPSFYPEGWNISAGMVMRRYWAKVSVPAPSMVAKVPIISLATFVEARRIKVSIWDHTSPLEDQCGPLFACVVNYLPTGTTYYVDGKEQAAYTWDGVSPNVRRADSLLYGLDARPVEWTMFADTTNFLVTLDLFATASAPTTGFEGDGQVRMGLSLVNKTD